MGNATLTHAERAVDAGRFRIARIAEVVQVVSRLAGTRGGAIFPGAAPVRAARGGARKVRGKVDADTLPLGRSASSFAANPARCFRFQARRDNAGGTVATGANDGARRVHAIPLAVVRDARIALSATSPRIALKAPDQGLAIRTRAGVARAHAAPAQRRKSRHSRQGAVRGADAALAARIPADVRVCDVHATRPHLVRGRYHPRRDIADRDGLACRRRHVAPGDGGRAERHAESRSS